MNSTFQPRFDLDKCSRNLAFILLFDCEDSRDFVTWVGLKLNWSMHLEYDCLGGSDII